MSCVCGERGASIGPRVQSALQYVTTPCCHVTMGESPKKIPRKTAGGAAMARPVLSASVALSLLQVAHCMVLATPEAAKLFGRFAESQLYLDKHVGACCHSAC